MTTTSRIYRNHNPFKQIFSWGIYFFIASALTLLSCNKLGNETEPLRTEEGTQLDELNDLIAYFNPFESVLLIDPEHLEEGLNALNAIPLDEGAYFMEGVNPQGNPVEVRFSISFSTSTDIFYQAESTDAKLLTPELIQEFEKNSTSYRLYKNARCGELQNGFTSACTNLTDGSSVNREWLPIRKCTSGTGYCTEANLIGGYEHSYEFANCQGPRKSTKNYYLYQCWQ